MKQLEAGGADGPKETSGSQLQKKIYKNVQGATARAAPSAPLVLTQGVSCWPASMTRQFVDVMTRYQDTQAQHQSLLRERVERQVPPPPPAHESMGIE